MSQLGKIFLFIALVGGIVAGVMGYLVIARYNAQTDTLNQTQNTLVVTKKDLKTSKDETTAAKAAKAEVDTKLTEANANIDTLNTQLTAAQKDAGDAHAAVQTAEDATKKAQAQLDQINSTLHGRSAADVQADVDKLTAQVAADNSEQKILQDQLQAATQKVADLKVEINKIGKPSDMPPGISGKVTYVNPAWNFVVLNVGLSNGVIPNGELIVYRGNVFIGKVKISSAEDNTAVADILPGAKADIQPGDSVLN